MRSFKLPALCSLALILGLNAFGQNYSVANIPEDLKDNAYAVVRKDLTECEVTSRSLMKIQTHYAITILDKSGDFLNSFDEYYDNYDRITEVRATLYNADGKKISTFRRGDFDDYSAVSGFSLYEESRVLTFEPSVNTYPYTIEYISTMNSRDFISLPGWFPVTTNHLSIQSSEYKLTVPEEYNVKYKFFNIDKNFSVTDKSGDKTYSVSMENQPARKAEPYSPSWDKIFPYVRIIPENFQMEKYKGSYSSWEEFGHWVNDLIGDRDQLTDEVKHEVEVLLEGIENDEEKVIKLYEYLQNSTRYVNIAYGIGGYQPHPAMSVYENGYGDCKALTNYMNSLLKLIGIDSYYTLVYAGSRRRDIRTEFPSQQFNHAILGVPLHSDTLWLECTSQRNPPGYHGRFTDDRVVLLISEEGGTLSRTKKYVPEDNLQIQNVIAFVNAQSFDMDVQVKTTFQGQQYSTVAGQIYESVEDQRENLLKGLDIPHFEIKDFNITESREGYDPIGKIELDLKVKNHTSRSGDRIFLPLNLMNKRSTAPKPNKDRINDFYLSYSYSDVDSITYKLPENTIIEYLPEAINLSEEFADYSFICKEQAGEILVIRKIKMRKGIYSKESYNTFADFMKKVVKADKSKALLRFS